MIKCNEVITADIQNLLHDFEIDSIDLIFTDPPYLSEYVYLYDVLGTLAMKVLKPSGFCISYVGHYYLDYAMDALKGAGLTYYWLFILKHAGDLAMVHSKKVVCCYKPIIIYQKPPFKSQEKYFADLARGSGKSKKHHDWQQSIEEALILIKTFSNRNEIVLDPFCGSGTSLVAAKYLGRQYIGVDIDPNTADIARNRLNETQNNNIGWW